MYKKEPIIGYEEYQIDTNGIVYSKKGKPLKYSINHKGYQIVNLYANHKRIGFDIHRLVAKQFIKNNDISKTQVNHKDGNKQIHNFSNHMALSSKWLGHKIFNLVMWFQIPQESPISSSMGYHADRYDVSRHNAERDESFGILDSESCGKLPF